MSNKKTINVDTVLSLTIDTIKIVQKLCRDYNGKYKKLVVIAIIRKLIEEHDYPSNDIRTKILEYVDLSLPNFIDISISLAKGSIDIGKKLSTFDKISCCC